MYVKLFSCQVHQILQSFRTSLCYQLLVYLSSGTQHQTSLLLPIIQLNSVSTFQLGSNQLVIILWCKVPVLLIRNKLSLYFSNLLQTTLLEWWQRASLGEAITVQRESGWWLMKQVKLHEWLLFDYYFNDWFQWLGKVCTQDKLPIQLEPITVSIAWSNEDYY